MRNFSQLMWHVMLYEALLIMVNFLLWSSVILGYSQETTASYTSGLVQISSNGESYFFQSLYYLEKKK